MVSRILIDKGVKQYFDAAGIMKNIQIGNFY